MNIKGALICFSALVEAKLLSNVKLTLYPFVPLCDSKSLYSWLVLGTDAH